MSKIIKSSNANTEQPMARTIQLRNLSMQTEIVNDHIEEADESAVSVADKAREAEELLAQANQKAEQIIASANQNVEQLYKELEQQQEQAQQDVEQAMNEAREAGYHDGFEEGNQAGKSEYSNLIQEAKQVIEASKKDYSERIEQSEPVIVELAIAVAEKIIGEALLEDQQKWESVVKQVIHEVREHREVKIYVHPSWYERTLQQKDELMTLLSYNDELFIYPDAQLADHGCVVESTFGRIDASVDSQLTEIKTRLLEKLKEDSDGRT
ncbi:flagellar assembly protein FliH [Desertibacillus haloalkaliphilus]|uniref:flagellar assembly protein FliH n=1 Tax=Desertibacillus haloalkaliphilus TaxID=1328930 RepID=UPI001C26B491|nr:flagellar assembly protein FliH [Desertibacillus haloalkaliphilus]MBU8907013.1 flagellar assembly protein FliH [Desertibacillus haloalkaliphilus]